MRKLRFLTPSIHSALDYVAAAGLIVFPMLLGFEGLPLWLSIGGGIGLIIYSLITDYQFGAVPVISFKAHIVLDLTAAAAFIVAPFIFNWTGLVMGYYFVMAAGVIVVVALTGPDPAVADEIGVSAGA